MVQALFMYTDRSDEYVLVQFIVSSIFLFNQKIIIFVSHQKLKL